MLSSYDQAVGNIIVKSRVALNQPPLTNPELAASIAAWAEILFGVIPEPELERSYLRAMQDRESDFPVGAPSLVKAFRDNCASDAASPRIAQDTNLLPGNVCSRCHGSGWEQYRDGNYMNSRRCDHVVDDDEDVSMF
jgi:hypothetical protein